MAATVSMIRIVTTISSSMSVKPERASCRRGVVMMRWESDRRDERALLHQQQVVVEVVDVIRAAGLIGRFVDRAANLLAAVAGVGVVGVVLVLGVVELL